GDPRQPGEGVALGEAGQVELQQPPPNLEVRLLHDVFGPVQVAADQGEHATGQAVLRSFDKLFESAVAGWRARAPAARGGPAGGTLSAGAEQQVGEDFSLGQHPFPRPRSLWHAQGSLVLQARFGRVRKRGRRGAIRTHRETLSYLRRNAAALSEIFSVG